VTRPLPDFLRRRSPRTAVPRAELRFVTLKLPPLKGAALRSAVRLQLLPYATPGRAQAYAYLPGPQGQVSVWLWSPAPELQPGVLRQLWPQPLLEAPGDGLRLVQRPSACEAQHWVDGQLRQTRLWPGAPSPQDWSLFVRACGLDPETHPAPRATVPTPAMPDSRWLRDDTLPEPAPLVGWRWQLGGLLLGAAIAFGIGAHFQTTRQIQHYRTLLTQLSSAREAALTQHSRYLDQRADFDALFALAPKVSQLQLLDKVVHSGVLNPPAAVPAKAGASSPPTGPGSVVKPAPLTGPAIGPASRAPTITATSASTQPPAPMAPSLGEWDYRNGRLKLSLDIPDGDLTMLDITRRIEKLPVFQDVRIGLDSGNNSLALDLRVVGANRETR
jgi:hypothetical protein